MTDIDHLRQFVGRAPSAQALVDRGLRFLAYSDRWVRVLGLDPETDYTGRNLYDVQPEIEGTWSDLHRRCLAGEGVRGDLEPFERPDGRTRWVRYETRPWYGAGGEVAGIVVLAEDLTEQVEAERRARAQAARLAALADAFALRTADDTDALEGVLARLLDLLGLDIGLVSRITPEEDRYEVVARAVPEGIEMERGATFPLGQTYCSIALVADDVLAIDEMAVSEHRRHPCYEAFGLETYIGAPVYVEGELYGTVNFSSSTPRAEPFTDSDRDLVRLVARWAGGVLETTGALARHAGAERRAAAWGAELELVQRAIPEALVFADADRRIRRVNPAFTRLFGHHEDDVLGHPTLSLYADPEDHGEAGRTRFNAGAQTSFEPYVVEYRRADGSVFPGETVGAPVRGPAGEVVGFLGLIRDVTDRRAMEEALYRQAHYDDLTGLPNRALFTSRLDATIAASADAPEVEAAVLFIDLDRFKVVNDTLGHSAGDRLLRALGGRLRGVVRPDDTVARLGGDEFAVLLDGAALEDARAVAQRAVQALSSPVDLDGREVTVGASVGVVAVRPDHRDPDAVLREADLAMYDAKAAGRGEAVTYTPAIHEAATLRMRLEMDLRYAVERGELRLAYQPIVRLEDGALAGFEALVRWAHPELGLLYPDVFIGPAEASGHVVAVDRWVLREATRQVAAWKEAYDHQGLLMLSVNCTGRDLLEQVYTDEVRAAVGDGGLDPSRLLIEITETLLVEDPEAVTSELEALRAYGVRFCVDDFGTGYSSLSVLHNLPVDTIKVDRSFVGNMDADERGRQLVRTVVELAGVLGKSVVGEGIETPAQLAALREMGCAYGQGYLFARPLRPEAAEALLGVADLPWVEIWERSAA